MLYISLVLFISMTWVFVVLTDQFNLRPALYDDIQDFIEKKKSLREVLNNFVAYASVNTLMSLSIGFVGCFFSLLAFLIRLFDLKGEIAVRALVTVTVAGISLSLGIITIIKRESPGYFKWRGIPAVILGWVSVLSALLFLLSLAY